MAIKRDKRKVIIISHSEVSTFEMAAPPFTLSTNPEESISISRYGDILQSKRIKQVNNKIKAKNKQE